MATATQVIAIDRKTMMEIDFVITQFMKLPADARRRMYEKIRGEGEDRFTCVGWELAGFLSNPAERDELLRFANEKMGAQATEYFLRRCNGDQIRRAALLAEHFRENLRLEGSEVRISLCDRQIRA